MHFLLCDRIWLWHIYLTRRFCKLAWGQKSRRGLAVLGGIQGSTGFDVRKRYTSFSKFDAKVTSCRFVCANEGHRRKKLTDRVTKCFRAEIRTDCKARMTLTLVEGKEIMKLLRLCWNWSLGPIQRSGQTLDVPWSEAPSPLWLVGPHRTAP